MSEARDTLTETGQEKKRHFLLLDLVLRLVKEKPLGTIGAVIVLVMFIVVDKMTPRIPFKNVEKNPNAVGVFVFGYLVFFGLILHAALTSPLL